MLLAVEGSPRRQARPLLKCDLGDVFAEIDGCHDAEKDLRRSSVKLDFLRQRIAEEPSDGGEGRPRRADEAIV